MFRRSPFTIVILIGALLLRALVPAGFMPDSDSLVTVCSTGGGGLQTIWINPVSGDWVEVDHETLNQQCPWALGYPDEALPALPANGIARLAPTCSTSGLLLEFTGTSLTHLPPARAPPLI